MVNKKIAELTKEEREQAKLIAQEKYRELEDEFLLFGEVKEVNYYKTIPPKFKKNWLKIKLGLVRNKRLIIKAKCCDCAGYENVDKNVGECTSALCPLWSVRPYQKKGK